MYNKVKKLFRKALWITIVVITVCIIGAVVSFIRGNIISGFIGIAPAVIYVALLLRCKSAFAPLYQIIEESDKLEEDSWNMTVEDLLALNDEELVSALDMRIMKETDFVEPLECLKKLNEEKKVVYILTYFDQEMQNGGLCQFFVNSSRDIAPFISENMGIVGADKYKKLFDDFVEENSIDLTDLDSFIIEDTKEYEKQYVRYDFDKFDDAFYELCEEDPLDGFIARYARDHIEKLAEKPGENNE